ncbi:hypothetical protein Hanom_Chr11g00999041 [Helianthus anomalus]
MNWVSPDPSEFWQRDINSGRVDWWRVWRRVNLDRRVLWRVVKWESMWAQVKGRGKEEGVWE